MTTRIGNITIDTNDLDGSAAFWAGVTGYAVTANGDGWATLAPPGGTAGPGLAIQLVPEPRATGKGRVHVDVFVDDLDAAVEQATTLGATEVRRVEDGDSRWVVVTDTEGNELCLVAA